MRRFLHDNGLTLFLAALFLTTFVFGQVLSGWHVHNEERTEWGERTVALSEYLTSAHFAEASTENWESEFLQMFIYIYVTSFLYQRGSAESNDPDEAPEEAVVSKDSPWPARQGGIWLKLYRHSLSLAFAGLFALCFTAHAYSSLKLENEERSWRGETPLTFREQVSGSKFWFESFQNWQSEFLAIGSMVVLSIFLRERHSPESKPVGAPHRATGC